MQEEDNSLEAQVKLYVRKFGKEHAEETKKLISEYRNEMIIKLETRLKDQNLTLDKGLEMAHNQISAVH